MRFQTLILFVALVSCQSPESSKQKATSDSKPINKALPDFVKNELDGDLKGYKFTLPSDWDDSVFNKYQTDSSQLNYFLADYNCDGKVDFAGILKDSTNNFSLVKIYSLNDYYIHDTLENFGNRKKLDIGVKYISPKTPFLNYDSSVRFFECGAIERFNINSKEKKVFYSNEKGYFIIEFGESVR